MIKKDTKEYYRNYRLKNKEQLKVIWARFSIKNKEKLREKAKRYYAENKEEIKKRTASYRVKYRKKNHEKLMAYHKEYTKSRLKNDINYRIAHSLRTRTRLALNGFCKSIQTLKLLGCSVEELKKHLEFQFQEGMNWKNYGQWHIDHIKPLSIFDLTNEKELIEGCNYKNLQPLWRVDNIRKSNKII